MDMLVDTDVMTLIGQAQTWLVTLGPRLLVALLIYLVGRYVARFLRRCVWATTTRARMDPNLVAFLSNLSYYGVIAFVILAVLGQLGIATTSLLAVLGAAGLAVGLALQGSLSNFAAGLLIVFFNPFRVGDVVESCDVTGVVEDIQLLTTVLRTFDNRVVIVPNSTLTSSNIINHSARATRRVDLEVTIDYSADLTRALRIIGEVVTAQPNVLHEPAPMIGVANLSEKGVTIMVQPWAALANTQQVRFDTLQNIKQRFDAAGIAFGGAQTEVTLQPMQVVKPTLPARQLARELGH